jgi:hypothetical protein
VLQQFIQDSLFRQRRSCLPQLGVFTLQHIPARYDVTSKTITPPVEEIHFSENREDDGKCLEWIGQREHLTPTVAKMKMDKYLDLLKQQLKTGRPFEIPGVGVLRADTVGRLTFTAEEMPLERDSLELQPVIRPEASHKVLVGNKEIVNNQVVDHVSANPGHAAPPPAEPAAYEPYPEEEKSSGFMWLWIAIPAIIVVGAAYFIWNAYNNNKPAQADNTPAPMDSSMLHHAADSTKTDSAVAATPAVPDSNAVIDYYVVIQTFRDQQKAVALAKKLEGHTHPAVAVITGRDSSIVRVAVRCESKRSDTTAQKEMIRKEYMLKSVSIEY